MKENRKDTRSISEKDLADAFDALNEGVGGYEEALTIFKAYMYGYKLMRVETGDQGSMPGRMFDISGRAADMIIQALEQQINDDKHMETMWDINKIKDPLEPIKVYFALRSELMKLEFRQVLIDWLKTNTDNKEEK